VESVAPARRARQQPSGGRWLALSALAVVLIAAAVTVRAITRTVAPLRYRRTLAAYVRIPGPIPTLVWPRQGEAAVEVSGVGSLGVAGAQTPVPIASVAKIMTAYLTLRQAPLARGAQGFVMSVSPADVKEQEARAALGESTLAVRVGERLTERQALEALLIPSANNIAALLARHLAGSVSAFVSDMNSMARTLGMAATTYTDPSGYEDSTRSSAGDQLKLAQRALAQTTFAEIVDQPAALLPVVGEVANFNGLVGSDGYVGVKTGSDRAAGGCLVFAKRIVVAGRSLIVLGVVLGQHGRSLIEAALLGAQRLGDSAAAVVRPRITLAAGTQVLRVHSVDGRNTSIVTAAPLLSVGWPGLDIAVQLRVEGAPQQLRAGQQTATLSADTHVSTVPARASSSLGKPSLGWRLEHVFG
jgi:D-alanyl-D-alanine carboxypeptidase (penicillin-binding protein 5/6)